MSGAADWKHDALAADLAAHLRQAGKRMLWLDMQMGPAGSPRPDVYSMPKSYARFTPVSYEVKVSRSDFMSDVNAAKWQKYLAYSSGVIFAVPRGLIKKNEIPAGTGLMWRGEEGWTTIKAPRLGVCETLPHAAWMKLLIDGVDRCASRATRSGTRDLRDRAMRAALGDEIADLIRDRDRLTTRLAAEKQVIENQIKSVVEDGRRRIEHERQRQAQIKPDIDHAWMELAEMLGLNSHQRGTFAIRQALAVRLDELDADRRVKHLTNCIENSKRALEQAVSTIPRQADDNVVRSIRAGGAQ